jgi:hypothetical protein
MPFKPYDLPIVESLYDVLERIGASTITVHTLDGTAHHPRACSLRLRTFKEDGVVCANCQAVATHWVLTFNPFPHLNLMGDNGILFTQDHIVPLSRGGDDNRENTQTMCMPCNSRLGDKQEPAPKKIESVRRVEVGYSGMRRQWFVKMPMSKKKTLIEWFGTQDEAIARAKELHSSPLIREYPPDVFEKTFPLISDTAFL